MHPGEVSALCAISAPHPLSALAALRRGRGTASLRHLLVMQLPMLPERRLADASTGFLAAHLRTWSADGSAFPGPVELATYQQAISLWPASHCALEYHRWLVRSRLRADGRRFGAAMVSPVHQPVCRIDGAVDRFAPAAGSRDRVAGPFTEHLLPGTGHFPHEEDPAGLTRLLLSWLAGL
jgi:pimeloyl-ACP methyl ester carboxylesterase